MEMIQMDEKGVKFSQKAVDYLLRLGPSDLRVMFMLAMRYARTGEDPKVIGWDVVQRHTWDVVKSEIDRLNEVPT